MADNMNVQEATEGTLRVVGADEVTRNGNTELQQIVKISLGAEGACDLLLDSGQQTMANSMPVAIASNQSAIPITDNSGSLTVDNEGTFAVQAAQSGTWSITDISGTVSLPTGAATEAKQPALGTAGSASSDVLTVQGITSMTPLLVNGSGVTQPVSGTVTANQGGAPWSVGGNVASEATDSGNPVKVGGVYNATPITFTDGDRGDLQLDENGYLKVNLVTGGGSGGTAMADDSAFTPGSSNVTPAGGVYRSSRDAVDDNDVGALAMTSKRALLACIETPNGDSAMDDTNDAVRVNIVAGSSSGTQYTEGDTDATITGTAIMWEDGSDTLTSVSAAKPLPVEIIAGSSSGTEYTEDAAAAANPVGPMTMAVRADSLSGVTTTDGDNIAIRATNNGELYVKHVDAVDINDISGTISLPTGAASEAKQDTIIGHVDGIEALLGTIDTDTGNIATSAATIASAVAGSEMQVDIVAALPAGTNAIGKLAANDGVDIGDVTINNTSLTVVQGTAANLNCTEASAGAIKTAVELIDDAVATTGSAITAKGLTMCGTDGTNARALKVDSSGELQVDVLTLPTLPAGSNAIGKLAANSGVDIGDVDVTSVTPGTTASSLGKAEDAGHNSGDVGVMALAVRTDTLAARATTDADYIPLVTDSQGALWTTIAANTNGGYTPGKIISAASTNATSTKASAGTLGYITASNVNASPRYLKVYNKASSPTVGTDTPVHTFLIPGNTAGAGTNIPLPPQGIKLDTGIAFALTTGAADNDNTGVAATEIIVNFGYK